MPGEIANQFTGLPMASLIGGPLQAVADAQLSLANTTKNFIETVGFEQVDTGKKDDNDKPIMKSQLRMVEFEYQRLLTPDGKSDSYGNSGVANMKLKVPFISIVKVPSLFVDTVDITFDMEVKSSEEEKTSDDKKGELEANASLKIGPFSVTAKIKGSISSHRENTRKTDTSAKYHVEVHAVDQGMPEGLARVLDIINANIAPVPVDNNTKDDEKKDDEKKDDEKKDEESAA